MAERPWWQRGVIYQIAVPSFSDADGDGMGDLRGIIAHLGYLRGDSVSLGVDAVWLTPIFESPMRDFGYDVTDFRRINPRLGTMDDLRELLDACHGRGLRVMLDLTLNHTSEEHPWFVASRSSREDPKRDWYVWRDGRRFGRPPNRWQSVVEGSAWRRDARTDQYYYHAFLPFQPDLNWRNPAVRAEMMDTVRFWLDTGADGFRLDLINFLYEDAELRENPRRLSWHPYGAQRHVYDRSRPESLEVVRELRRIADSYPDRALMGEIYTDCPEESVAFCGDGSDGLHLAFYLDFAVHKWRADRFRSSVDWLEEHLPAGAWPCYYLNNHDLPRTYSRLGGRHRDARARVAAAMLLTLRGTPILYYGEELGMPTARIPRRLMVDPIGAKFWPIPFGRDGSRTPLPWSAGAGAGFTSGTPWLPADPSHAVRNVEAEASDPASLLSWYRALIALRAATPALHSGSYRALAGTPPHVFGYVREAEGERVTVLLNFSARGAACPLAEQLFSRVLLSTHRAVGDPLAPGDLVLGPHEVAILA